MANDISEEEAQQKLQQLLQEFSSIFNSEDKSPAKTPVIDIPLKYEYKDKIFFDLNRYDRKEIKTSLIRMPNNL